MYSRFCFDNIKGSSRYSFAIAKSVNPFKINRKVIDIELMRILTIRNCINKKYCFLFYCILNFNCISPTHRVEEYYNCANSAIIRARATKFEDSITYL